MNFLCPVCGYPGLSEAPYDGTSPSFEICPSCGTEFGYEDATRSHAELRKAWIEDGCRWWSTFQPSPPDWDPKNQLSRLKDK